MPLPRKKVTENRLKDIGEMRREIPEWRKDFWRTYNEMAGIKLNSSQEVEEAMENQATEVLNKLKNS